MPRTPVKPGRLRKPRATLAGRRCRNGHVGRSYVTAGGKIECRTCKALRHRRLWQERRRERLRARRERILARVRPNRRERIWAAGLFEGEGTITIRSTGAAGHTMPEVSMVSTDAQVVEVFQTLWPGHTERYTPKSRTGRARQAIRWKRNATEAVEGFLLDLYPYFKTARVRTKADLLMEDIRDRVELRLTPGRKQRLRARMARMRRLNRRGTGPWEPGSASPSAASDCGLL